MLGSVVAGIIIFILVIGKLAPVIDLIKIYSKANIDIQYLPALLKIIGIAYMNLAQKYVGMPEKMQ